MNTTKIDATASETTKPELTSENLVAIRKQIAETKRKFATANDAEIDEIANGLIKLKNDENSAHERGNCHETHYSLVYHVCYDPVDRLC